ncbi:MAG: hypothetical protein ACYC6L_12835 [Anaerolineae bacterium]
MKMKCKPGYKIAVLVSTALLALVPVLTGCAKAAESRGNTTTTVYTDPFTYCAAVGTVDTPQGDYSGVKVPESVAKGLQTALNAPDTPLNILENESVWRCMDGSVYACFVGANLPCEARANTDRTPAKAVADYCHQNPKADVVPADITGRETVYEWRCKGGVPEIARQVFQADARGFIAEIWYKISP